MVGASVSIVAALTVVLINFIATAIAPELTIQKYNQSINTLPEFLATNVGIILETFVFGMITTFICLQYLKQKSNSRSGSYES
ncbi:MAG: hypothetical protein AAFO94_11345, partial [Bacteroidota bacterium]